MNRKLIPSTAAIVLSWRATAESAKATSRALRLPIASIVYGALIGWKSTSTDSPANRMKEVAVSRSPFTATASAPAAHSSLTTARMSRSCSTATCSCGVVPGRPLAGEVGAGGSSSSIRTPGPVAGSAPDVSSSRFSSSLLPGSWASRRPATSLASDLARPSSESPVCCSRWIRSIRSLRAASRAGADWCCCW